MDPLYRLPAGTPSLVFFGAGADVPETAAKCPPGDCPEALSVLILPGFFT
jgi:hypothetical protein